MPLTEHEEAFLAAYVYEATTEPFFSGPASKKIKANGIFYSDIPSLCHAYERRHPPTCTETTLYWGRPDPNPPECPWPNREAALRRNQELEQELSRRTRDQQ
jgi:hypothetical protein